ncbi:hypothetical protein Q2T49_33885 [Pseudomonas aeruginosa]|nr:hypothetical protein [Pseudomonas aeruginosa]MDO1592119.1 hypothetical protein [Pseudomonas aeruginosa]
MQSAVNAQVAAIFAATGQYFYRQ